MHIVFTVAKMVAIAMVIVTGLVRLGQGELNQCTRGEGVGGAYCKLERGVYLGNVWPQLRDYARRSNLFTQIHKTNKQSRSNLPTILINERVVLKSILTDDARFIYHHANHSRPLTTTHMTSVDLKMLYLKQSLVFSRIIKTKVNISCYHSTLFFLECFLRTTSDVSPDRLHNSLQRRIRRDHEWH